MSNANRFAPLSAERLAPCSRFGQWEQTYFPGHIGIRLEEVRTASGTLAATANVVYHVGKPRLAPMGPPS